MSPVKAVGYIRVSRVGERGGDTFISPELQRQSIKRACSREGLTLIDQYEELDASGGDSSRPLWLKAIEKIESGEAQALVVWNLSRFSRSTVDALKAIDRIEAAGGRLYSEEGNLGKLSRTILFAVAEDERDRARAGFRSAQANAIGRGIYIAARIPFGYVRGPDRRLTPDPETGAIIKELFERRIKGESWTDLTRWLITVPGAPTTRKGVRDMVANVAYLGHARGVAGIVRELHDQGAATVYRQSWPDSAKHRPAEPMNLTSDELAAELEAARGRDGLGPADVWLRITEEGLKELRSRRP